MAKPDKVDKEAGKSARGATSAKPASRPAAYSGARLDRLIHDRVRLGILSALAANESMSFNELKQVLELSDGNLSVHARKLEEAGYLACSKRFEGRVPRTSYALTAAGRKALEQYLSHMEALIDSVRKR